LSQFKLKLYTDKPHVVCLCETWTKPGEEPSFINYRAIWQHRTHKQGGGLACLIRRDIAIINSNFVLYGNGLLEAQMVAIRTTKETITIMNRYI
jgi:exonuclease III